MSISKVHDLLQNKGCIWTVSILMVLSVVGGTFFQCGKADQMNGARRQDPGATLATLNGFEITQRLVDNELQRGAQNYGGLANLPPSFQLQLQASVLRSTIGNILQLEMAKKRGIEPSDAEIEKILNESIGQEVDRVKQQMTMQGRLKPDATEADFAAEFKKVTGKDLGDFKKQAIEENLAMVRSGSDMRLPVASLAIGQPLMDAIKSEIKLSDEDLKKTYDSYQFKRITLQKGDPDATAKKILQELKTGLTFEKAMERYSETPPDPKVKIGDKIEPLTRINMRGFEPYQPLEKLKPGEVSEAIPIGQTVNIWKLISIKNELPKDFEKKKATYKETQLASLAAGKLQSDLQAMQKDAKVEWKSNVYKLLYEYGRMMGESLSVADRDKLQRKLMTDAIKEASEGDPADARTAGTLAYVCFQDVYSKASPEEKKKLAPEKEKVYETYLLDNEDTSMRLELAELYLSQKKPEFAKQLDAAANANLGLTDAAGQSIYSKINKLIKDGKDAKVLTAEEAKTIEGLQKQWVQQKIEDDKYKAEEKKAQEEYEKKAAEEAKKAKEKAAGQVKTREELEKEKAKAKTGGTK